MARRLAWPSALAATCAALVAVAVFPTRTYLTQRSDIEQASAHLEALETSNGRLRDHLDRLDSDEEIERVARQEYGLVKPGEEVYRIVPEAEDPVTMPTGWPFERLRKRLGAVPPADTTPDGAAPSTTSTTFGLPPARD